jgi:DNA gyrase subunit A
LALEPHERVTAIACVENFESGYFVFCTQQAKIKRVELSEFAAVRSNGLIAISLNEDDTLRWVRRSSGDDTIMIVTGLGQAIRFEEDEVRVMGRQAAGVNAIRLREGDTLAGVDVIDETVQTIMVVTARGFGKQTPVDRYPVRGRYGFGVQTIDPDAIPKVGMIVSAHVLRGGEDITLISAEGIALRTPSSSVRLAGRSTMGVRLIKLPKKDKVVSVAVVESSPEEKIEGGEELEDTLGVAHTASDNGAELANGAEVDLDGELDADIDAELDDADMDDDSDGDLAEHDDDDEAQ